MLSSFDEIPLGFMKAKNVTTYCALADQVADATTYETLLNKTNYQGYLSIPANYLEAGDLFEVALRGYYRSSANSTNKVKYTLNNTVLFESLGGILPSTAGNDTYVDFIFCFQVRSIGSTGKAVINGRTIFPSAQGITTVTQMRPVAVPAEVTIDTTIAQTFDAQYLWGSAVGSMTIQMANIFKKRV